MSCFADSSSLLGRNPTGRPPGMIGTACRSPVMRIIYEPFPAKFFACGGPRKKSDCARRLSGPCPRFRPGSRARFRPNSPSRFRPGGACPRVGKENPARLSQVEGAGAQEGGSCSPDLEKRENAEGPRKGSGILDGNRSRRGSLGSFRLEEVRTRPRCGRRKGGPPPLVGGGSQRGPGRRGPSNRLGRGGQAHPRVGPGFPPAPVGGLRPGGRGGIPS